MDKQEAWEASLQRKFGVLWERLDAEKIAYTTENTGGGCMVLFVRFPDGSLVTVTPSEKPSTDPRNHWMACGSADEDTFWSGDDDPLHNCAHTDHVIMLLRLWPILSL